MSRFKIPGSIKLFSVTLFFLMFLFKRGIIKTYLGENIRVAPKRKGFARNIIGGTIFGLGWALAGACPGPMFILLGRGVAAIVVVIIGGLLGALLYHTLKSKLPH